jgi:tripartite-type tricarboxylate transporter receptor subunit TctC
LKKHLTPPSPKRTAHALWLRLRPLRASLLLGVAGALAASHALAEEPASYPSKPLRIILSTPAGGTLDAVGRMIGEKMTADWK